jgi:hypothetical protein
MQKARRHPPNVTPTACKRTVSGTISLPCSGYFSPFPHGTSSLSVSQEYLALPDGPGRIQTGFHVSRPTQDTARYNYISPTGLSPSMVCLSRSVLLIFTSPHRSPTTPMPKQNGLGCSPFARHYLGITIVFFSSGYLDVSVHRVRFLSMLRLQRIGLPHSDIYGSKVICTSPKLIAAYHVLRRL